MTKRPTTPRRTAGRADEPRRRGVRSITEMLPHVGAAAFKRFGFVQSSVVSRWAEIVGDRYADVSSPEMIRFPTGKRNGGTLVLAVDGAHAPMMQHVAPAIIERVNRFFGYPAVAKMAIQQGALPKRLAKRALPSVQPVSHEMGESVRAIVDPELRDCLAALAAAVAASEGPPGVGTVPPIRLPRSND